MKSVSLLLALIGIQLQTSLTIRHDDFFEPNAIHFPLRDVQHSINLESFATTERNVTIGKCEQVTSTRNNLVLNLPNLGITPPPNPYPGFIDSQLVTCVNLASNGIYQLVPGSFDRTPNLNYLDLSSNRLALCDFFNFGPHPNLETLVIERNINPLDNIDKTISKTPCFPKLRNLYLRQNGIRSLNFSLKKAFPGLKHLVLSQNSIDSGHTFIREPPNTLSHVDVSGNLISSLDCKIIREVTELNVDDNIIGTICQSTCSSSASLKLEGVHKLKILTVTNNRINDLESCSFRHAKSIEILKLSGNNIEAIKRETFEHIVELRELWIDDNRLSVVPCLVKNRNLNLISLKRNKLTIIRNDDFRGMRKLQYLYLGGNRLNSIEAGSFQDLDSLNELDLSSNDLDFIPSDLLKWQWNLRVLDVRDNRFKCLEQMSLGSAPFLTTIFMQNNPITHLSGKILTKLSPNVVLYAQRDDFMGRRDHGFNGSMDCYARCDENRSRNETYSRWINNL